MRVLLAFLTLLILNSCADSQALVDCKQNSLLIDGKSIDLAKLELEKVNGQFNLAVAMESEMFQLSFGKAEPRAVLINFQSSPMISTDEMSFDYREMNGLISLNSSGTLKKGEQEQSFKICVKDLSYVSEELIEE